MAGAAMLGCAHARPEPTTQAAEKPNRARRWIVIHCDATPPDIDSIHRSESCSSQRQVRKEWGEVTASAVVIIPLVMIIMFAIVQSAIGRYAQLID